MGSTISRLQLIGTDKLSFLFTLVKGGLFALDAERAHGLTIKALRHGLVPHCEVADDPCLVQELCGLKFANPIGLAAGFDKNAQVFSQMLSLGFGFAEVGSITPKAQAGNPKPRIFRLENDNAVINALGFNNLGHDFALRQLSDGKERKGPVGVNVGANKTSEDFTADYEAGLRKFWPVADYFTANISSPNTPGLRDLQARTNLEAMLTRLEKTVESCSREFGVSRPLFLKIAPDLTEAQIDEIADVLNQSALSGVIVSNTTVERPASLQSSNATRTGGLSGRPLYERSTIVLAKIRKRLAARYVIIGVGGVENVETALGKIEAGANLVQLYTAMIYRGPDLAANICNGLLKEMRSSGQRNIAEHVGTKTDFWADKSLA